MNLEQMRIRLNVFRVQTRQHKISEQSINCFVEINGKRVPLSSIKFERTDNGNGSFNAIMEG